MLVLIINWVLVAYAVVLAVSTMLPNPLQTLAQLHARSVELPSWVDSTHSAVLSDRPSRKFSPVR
jgi:hypothetical protein